MPHWGSSGSSGQQILSSQAPLHADPEDIDDAGQDARGHHSVTGFHAAGPTDVAQEGIAARHGGRRNP